MSPDMRRTKSLGSALEPSALKGQASPPRRITLDGAALPKGYASPPRRTPPRALDIPTGHASPGRRSAGPGTPKGPLVPLRPMLPKPKPVPLTSACCRIDATIFFCSYFRSNNDRPNRQRSPNHLSVTP